MAGELPVWVCGQQLWVKGVDAKTTCNDVIAALVGRAEEGIYAIVERWRGVERPLGGLVRVWKVWSQWADAQGEVRLTLRRLPHPEEPDPDRKKHSRQTQGPHPKKQCHLGKTHDIEKLLKLILAQGETIQNQLKKLHEREVRVETEERVPNPYSGRAEDEKENDSGLGVTSSPTSHTDPPLDLASEKRQLQRKIELWEKIVKLNKKLEKEEETLVRLYVNLQRNAKKDEALVLAELRRIEIESERGAKELEQNSYNLSKADVWLTERRNYLEKLHLELEASEKETARLLRINESISKSENKPPPDVDSNSDTGLSSLHSSSEEGTYVLDAIL